MFSMQSRMGQILWKVRSVVIQRSMTTSTKDTKFNLESLRGTQFHSYKTLSLQHFLIVNMLRDQPLQLMSQTNCKSVRTPSHLESLMKMTLTVEERKQVQMWFDYPNAKFNLRSKEYSDGIRCTIVSLQSDGLGPAVLLKIDKLDQAEVLSVVNSSDTTASQVFIKRDTTHI